MINWLADGLTSFYDKLLSGWSDLILWEIDWQMTSDLILEKLICRWSDLILWEIDWQMVWPHSMRNWFPNGLTSFYDKLIGRWSDLILELLDLWRQFFCLLDIVPLGLAFTVQYLEQVQVLLFQLLLLLQYFAETEDNGWTKTMWNSQLDCYGSHPQKCTRSLSNVKL